MNSGCYARACAVLAAMVCFVISRLAAQMHQVFLELFPSIAQHRLTRQLLGILNTTQTYDFHRQVYDISEKSVRNKLTWISL